MPTYEFRCRACGATFTVNRPMAQSGAPASCPEGHADTIRLLSMAGAISAATAGAAERPSAAGGCCGGGCCT